MLKNHRVFNQVITKLLLYRINIKVDILTIGASIIICAENKICNLFQLFRIFFCHKFYLQIFITWDFCNFFIDV